MARTPFLAWRAAARTGRTDALVKCLWDVSQIRNLGERQTRAFLASTRGAELRQWELRHSQGPPSFASRGIQEASQATERADPGVKSTAYKVSEDANKPTPNGSNYTPADAEQCDATIASLDAARRRAEASLRQAQQTKPAKKMAEAWRYLRDFLASIPGAWKRIRAMDAAEWREWFRKLGVSAKNAAQHYWTGTKLLALEVKIAVGFLGKVVEGKALTRREKRQLTRTAADMFRLVPMLVFVLVPFMEFLLPVALKIFPNMLPSTFQDRLQEEEQYKKRLRAKIELAKFLQDTVEEMASEISKTRGGEVQTTAEELSAFVSRARSGEKIDNQEILRFARLFNDELTLDHLDRSQLVNLSRFVGLSPFGSDPFIRSKLRKHLQKIRTDDQMIRDEGIESLTAEELRAACRARGMRAPFGSESISFMRRQLTEWLDLSLNQNLPSSLLLLSRAFTILHAGRGAESKTVTQQALDDMQETITSLPDEVMEDLEFASRSEKTRAEQLQQRFDYFQREQAMIQEELEDLAVTDKALLEMRSATVADQRPKDGKELAAEFPTINEELADRVLQAQTRKMKGVQTALAVLSSSSSVSVERAQFLRLAEKEILKYNELATRRVPQLLFRAGKIENNRDVQAAEKDAATSALSNRVNTLLVSLEKELDDVECKLGQKLKMIDTDNDGVIGTEEVRLALTFLKETLGEDELRSLLERLDSDMDGKISIGDLLSLLEENKESNE